MFADCRCWSEPLALPSCARRVLPVIRCTTVWALGVLSYELVHGRPPFLGAMREETERLIAEQEVAVAAQVGSPPCWRL